MELTVGYLKKVLSQLDDNVVIADLEIGNDKFSPFLNLKRLLVVKDVSENKNLGGHTYLVINSLGSHFSGCDEQKNLEYQGIFFDDESF